MLRKSGNHLQVASVVLETYVTFHGGINRWAVSRGIIIRSIYRFRFYSGFTSAYALCLRFSVCLCAIEIS